MIARETLAGYGQAVYKWQVEVVKQAKIDV
jgi:hypothetical protein